MLARMTAMFANTESAQAAARRLDRKHGICEIRMMYRTEYDNPSYHDVLYAQNPAVRMQFSDMIQPRPLDPPLRELSNECRISVSASVDALAGAKEVVINEGGYGLRVDFV